MKKIKESLPVSKAKLILLFLGLTLVVLSFSFTFTEEKIMQNKLSEIIIDSDMNFEQAVAGLQFPNKIKEELSLVKVKYLGFDKQLHQGELVVNRKVADEVKTIFMKLLTVKFPIEKVIPISAFGWDDEKSMKDNNTSAFNYRVIKGTDRLSNHSFGLAIDVNPLLNPYVKKNSVEPEGAVYNPTIPGTITENSQIVKIFKSYGWHWGGDWKKGKDYQHFEKEIEKK
jgi:peptidoglycan L-alanyl-D-glutamate endopeptidase CwlK